jgi:hypothetical protein
MVHRKSVPVRASGASPARPTRRLVLLTVLAASVAVSSCTTANPPSSAPAATTSSGGAGNGGSNGSTPGSQSARDDKPDYTSFLDEGPMTKERALQSFALVYGSLPGVDTPKDIAFPGGTVTNVLFAAAKFWDEFTDEQRQAISDRLTKGHTQTRIEPPAATTNGTATKGTAKRTSSSERGAPTAQLAAVAAVPAVATQTPESIDTMIGRALGELQVRLGTTEYPTISLDVLDTPGVEGDDGETGTWAMAQPYIDMFAFNREARGSDPVNDVCVIHIGTNATTHSASASFSAIVHEVFHCFQFMSFPGSVDDWNEIPEWIYESSAAWVGEEVADGSDSPLAQSWWTRYLQGSDGGGYLVPDNNPYLAIGLWEFLDTAGEPVWDRVLPVLAHRSSGDAFTFIVGDVDKLDTWTSSTYRQSWPPSGAWDLQVTNQQPTSASRTTQPGTIPKGDTEATAPAMAQHAYRYTVDDDAEFVTINETGPSIVTWLDDGPSLRFAGGGRGVYCLIDDCTCPDGSQPFGGHFEHIAGHRSLAVAVTGTGTNTSKVKMTGLGKDDVCRPCEGSGDSSGEPASIRGAQAQPTEEGSGECEDPCLTGKWQADTSDMARQLQEFMGSRGHATTVTATGAYLIDFESPTVTVTWGHVIRSVTPLDADIGLVLTTTATFTGSSTAAEYHAVAGTITYAPGEAGTLNVSTVSDINGRSTPATDSGMGAWANLFQGASQYECNGPDLRLTGEGTPFTILFHRV